MTDPAAFLVAVLAVLATPGPTNTLLATSGAAAGVRQSLPLIVAEAIGYGVSILVLGLLVGPLLRQMPAVDAALRLGCGAYLVHVAWRLWTEAGNLLQASRPVPFRQVLATTLLNPKGALFAFVLVPHLAEGRVTPALPYLAGLTACIAVVALGWICLGAGLRSGAVALRPVTARRCGAVVLAGLAVVLSVSVLA